MSENKQPKIRFKEHIDGWEQHKLIELSDMYNNLRVPVTASDRIAGDTPYYGANGIQDYVEGFTHRGEYVLLAEDGANDLLNYPVHYINGTVWINNHAHVISGKSGQLCNLFLVSRMRTLNMVPWLVGGGRAKLNGEVLKNIPILIPSYIEQQKIGTFFKTLDDNIDLYEQRLYYTKELKKTMLKKMFPQKGQSVPEIRFKGFTAEWGIGKLGELCNIATGKLNANAMNPEGEFAFFTSGKNVYRTDSFAFDGEAILIAGNGNVGYQHKYEGKFNAYQRTYVLMDFVQNREVISNQIELKLPRVIAKETRTGVIPYIVKDMLTDLTIKYPTDDSESELIGGYFLSLESQIDALEDKVETLKEFKKTMLRKMFI